ncbi:MAG: gas vesicle protein [Actinomycetota bacterium]|nr:gas vesicle protein [Actinomycetota bacterium]
MAQSEETAHDRRSDRDGKDPSQGHREGDRHNRDGDRHGDSRARGGEGEGDRHTRDGDGDSDGGGHGEQRRKRVGAVEVARRAIEQLVELTGRSPDTVTSIERLDDGWHLTVELVELERIPASTNLLGSYDAELDEEGNLMSYERIRRYHRGQADEF